MTSRFLRSIVLVSVLTASGAALAQDSSLWPLYESQLKSAKYIDLTHAFEPVQPVWPGFAGTKFKPSVAGRDIEGFVKAGEEFTYEEHGFVATAYELTTDQYGTPVQAAMPATSRLPRPTGQRAPRSARPQARRCRSSPRP